MRITTGRPGPSADQYAERPFTRGLTCSTKSLGNLCIVRTEVYSIRAGQEGGRWISVSVKYPRTRIRRGRVAPSVTRRLEAKPEKSQVSGRSAARFTIS